MTKRFRRYPLGRRIGDDLTLVEAITNARGRHPVYLGWRHSAWAPVVCKVFRTLEDAEREYAALKACAHPSVVQAFGVYQPDFLLMEFLDGETLRRHMRRGRGGRLSIADALRTTIPLGAALAKTHAAGFMHLDVKPENIMIVDERPVLFDFGAARRIDARRPSKPQGTAAYAAPEENEVRPTGPAADIFSLGVVLYELLTGELPFGFEGGDPFRGPVRSFRPRVAAELDRLVLACMAADPADRPSLAELLPALNRQIPSGPRMWPDELDLALRAKRRPVAAGMARPLLPTEQDNGACRPWIVVGSKSQCLAA